MNFDTPTPPCENDGGIPEGQELLLIIKDYLSAGGMFNPELMDHDKVRDLIIDCRKWIESQLPPAKRCAHIYVWRLRTGEIWGQPSDLSNYDRGLIKGICKYCWHIH